MSIKIYYGNRVWAESLDVAISILKENKKTIELMLLKERAKEILIKAITIFDENILRITCLEDYRSQKIEKNYIEDLGKSAIYLALEYLRKENDDESEKEQYNEILHYIYPVKFTENERSYYLFTSHNNNISRDLNKFYFSSLKDTEEYAFWDNTDPPEDLDEKSWSKRSDDWSIALTNETGIPREEGLSVSVANIPTLISFITKTDHNMLSDQLIELNNIRTINIRKNYYLDNFVKQQVYDSLVEQNLIKRYSLACKLVKEGEITEEITAMQVKANIEIDMVLEHIIPYEHLCEPLSNILTDAKRKYLKEKLDVTTNKKINKSKIKNKI